MELPNYYKGLEIRQDQYGQAAYIMYHGTTFQNANNIIWNGFVQSTDGMLGPGVYVSRSFQKAAAYPITLPPGEARVILQLRVQVGNVIRIDYQGHPLQKTWHQAGYDTAWVPPYCGMVPSGLEEDCVWDPRRIDVLKVLNNSGVILYPASTTMALPYTFGPYPPSGPPGPFPPYVWFPLKTVFSNNTYFMSELLMSYSTLCNKDWLQYKLTYMLVFSPSDHPNSNFTIMELPNYFTDLEIRQDQYGQTAYIMYHGTTFQNGKNIIRNGFVRSIDGMLGPGVYVSRSVQKAAAYPIALPPGEIQVILQLRVQVGNVIRIDYQNHPLQKTWHQVGYDTAWVPPRCGMVPSGLEEDCVWDPRRIEVLQVLMNFGGVLYPVSPTMALLYTFGPYPPSGPPGPFPPNSWFR
ncbi:uncharacterized protein Hap1MRO34_023526 [Clarias gariepinus]